MADCDEKFESNDSRALDTTHNVEIAKIIRTEYNLIDINKDG
jgi:hypothetical protein